MMLRAQSDRCRARWESSGAARSMIRNRLARPGRLALGSGRGGRYVVHGPDRGGSMTQLPRGSDATNNRM